MVIHASLTIAPGGGYWLLGGEGELFPKEEANGLLRAARFCAFVLTAAGDETGLLGSRDNYDCHLTPRDMSRRRQRLAD